MGIAWTERAEATTICLTHDLAWCAVTRKFYFLGKCYLHVRKVSEWPSVFEAMHELLLIQIIQSRTVLLRPIGIHQQITCSSI